jgi:hypothetical protein
MRLAIVRNFGRGHNPFRTWVGLVSNRSLSQVGPAVRIRFPPAKSQQRTLNGADRMLAHKIPVLSRDLACYVEIVPNCNHFYVGREATICELVSNWLVRTLDIGARLSR